MNFEMELLSLPATEPAIVSLESEIGWPLPTDYKEFLKKYNYCKPLRRCGVMLNEWDETQLNSFLGLGPDVPDYGDIRHFRSIFLEAFSTQAARNQVIPVAGDGVGNLFMIRDSGGVYFHDHETDELHRIRDNWTLFLESVEEEEEEEEERSP